MRTPAFSHELETLTTKYRKEAVKGIGATYTLDGSKVLEIAQFFVREHDRWVKAWKIMLPHQKQLYPCPFCEKECLEVLWWSSHGSARRGVAKKTSEIHSGL